jgi:hypothetical protein
MGPAATLIGLQVTFILLISVNVKGQEQPVEPAIELILPKKLVCTYYALGKGIL